MKKILVVDDDEDILEVVRISLEFYGFDVSARSTGLNVQDVVQQYQPDLILLNIFLPGKPGTEICKELKRLDSKRPIVLFSANAEKGKKFSEFNADGFIEKPFDILQLVNAIKSFLK
jgi:DNA-binding response OmpR family regulator